MSDKLGTWAFRERICNFKLKDRRASPRAFVFLCFGNTGHCFLIDSQRQKGQAYVRVLGYFSVSSRCTSHNFMMNG